MIVLFAQFHRRATSSTDNRQTQTVAMSAIAGQKCQLAVNIPPSFAVDQFVY
jgi:hypothetical protein